MGFRGASGPARLALGLVLVILILRLSTAAIALLLPEGRGALVPASGGGKEVWISLGWTAFTLVAVGARHWIGAASAIWLLTLSAITGGRLLVGSLVGLAALAFALRTGMWGRRRREQGCLMSGGVTESSS